MSNSRSNRDGIDLAGSRTSELLLKMARSWQIGLVLAVTAVGFVAFSWRSIDFSRLETISLRTQAAAGLAYAAALCLLATAMRTPNPERSAELRASTLAAQLLKYVPGTVWQGQAVFAVAGMSGVFQFATTVLTAAGFGLMLTGSFIPFLVGVTVAVAALAFAVNSFGRGHAIRLGLFAVAVVGTVGLSGGLVGWALGLDGIRSAQDMAAAWGFGAIALPVPAGLGIRELYLSVFTDSDVNAQLGLAHRALTIVVDSILGLLGVWMGWRIRKSR